MRTRLALQIVGRGQRQTGDHAGDRKHQPDDQQPRRRRTGDAQEAGGVGEEVHDRVAH